MSKNNYARLKEEADIQAVIDYLGIEVTRRGTANFLLCPLPGHDDHQATNCYFKDGWNNVYCSVCHTSVNAIDLIKYTKNCSFGEAADLLWEIEGQPGWYYSNFKKKTKESFSLSREEMELIDLHYPSHVLLARSESDMKEDLPKGYAYDNDYMDSYLKCEVGRYTWQDFMSEKEYIALVVEKTMEQFMKMHDISVFMKKMYMILRNKESKISYEAALARCEQLDKLYQKVEKLA